MRGQSPQAEARWRRGARVLGRLVAGHTSARADDWEIETKDGVRTAIVMPAPQAPAPTVIVLHGATISADLTARWSGFAEAAAAHGFAAVFPEGIYRLWNDARGDKLRAAMTWASCGG